MGSKVALGVDPEFVRAVLEATVLDTVDDTVAGLVLEVPAVYLDDMDNVTIEDIVTDRLRDGDAEADADVDVLAKFADDCAEALDVE